MKAIEQFFPLVLFHYAVQGRYNFKVWAQNLKTNEIKTNETVQ